MYMYVLSAVKAGLLLYLKLCGM